MNQQIRERNHGSVSEDDVVYAEEHEEEIQQINLRNEVTNQITVDTCGERCARLDEFNWVLPAKVWNEESDTPESDFETSDSGNSVHANAADTSSPKMETTSQRLSSPPVVAQTRPKGGCQTAMPRRKRRRRSVWTTDSASAMDTRQESVAPSTLDSERIHKKSECITKGEPIWEAAPPASHRMAQPKCSDCSHTDPLPSGSGHLSPAGHDTPAEKPPAEMNICNTPDNLQIKMSVMLLKMADGSPPAEVTILTDSDILQKELSVMTVTSKITEKWMDRFVVDLVESPSVSRKNAVARTFGPGVSEEYSPVVFAGGGAVADAYPLVVVESDSALVSGLRPVVSDPALVYV